MPDQIQVVLFSWNARLQTTGRTRAVLENPKKVSNLEQRRRWANSTLQAVVVGPLLRRRAVLLVQAWVSVCQLDYV
jgi:hypothetical protein